MENTLTNNQINATIVTYSAEPVPVLKLTTAFLANQAVFIPPKRFPVSKNAPITPNYSTLFPKNVSPVRKTVPTVTKNNKNVPNVTPLCFYSISRAFRNAPKALLYTKMSVLNVQ